MTMLWLPRTRWLAGGAGAGRGGRLGGVSLIKSTMFLPWMLKTLVTDGFPERVNEALCGGFDELHQVAALGGHVALVQLAQHAVG